jgi:hypothetical protein
MNDEDLDCPSEEQIQTACKKIQETWSDKERKIRSGMIERWDGKQYFLPAESWTTPQFLPKFSYIGRKARKRMTKVWAGI